MPATYEPIATVTLTTSAANIEFTSIPSTYTDLIIQGVMLSASTSDDTKVQLNGDTGNNYSWTRLYGEASVASDRGTSTANMFLGRNSTTPTANIIHIMNYSNTSTYKTCLGRSGFATGIVLMNVGTWRSNSAVTSVKLLNTGNDFSSGTTVTLYGIKAA